MAAPKWAPLLLLGLALMAVAVQAASKNDDPGHGHNKTPQSGLDDGHDDDGDHHPPEKSPPPPKNTPPPPQTPPPPTPYGVHSSPLPSPPPVVTPPPSPVPVPPPPSPPPPVVMPPPPPSSPPPVVTPPPSPVLVPPPPSPPPSIVTPPPPSSPPPVVTPPPSPVPVPPPPSTMVYCKNTAKYYTCTAPAPCPATCPYTCQMDCDSCKPVCECDKPGGVCDDPKFIGGDGNTFYFHGRRDRDFCLLSDADLHINGHFIGNHVPGLKRDPTWVQAIAVQFSGHRLYVGALKTAAWDDEADRLEVVFDGEPVHVPGAVDARWEAPAVPALSVTRTKAANGVAVELAGVFRITANAVPITEEDSRVHNYGLTAGDCLAHLDLAFKFHALTDDVHGVLGQTYRSGYVNQLDVSAKMPVMGGERDFVASGLFATDCAVARFGRGSSADALAVASDELASVTCSTGLTGVGVVCKK